MRWLVYCTHLYQCWPVYKRSQVPVLSSSQTDPTDWVPPCGVHPLSPCDTENISGQTPSSLFWCPPWPAAGRRRKTWINVCYKSVVGYWSVITHEVSGKTPVRQIGFQTQWVVKKNTLKLPECCMKKVAVTNKIYPSITTSDTNKH